MTKCDICGKEMIVVQGWDFLVEMCMRGHKPRLHHETWCHSAKPEDWESKEKKDVPECWIKEYNRYEKNVNPSNRYWK
jgi:hypothetical protein